MHDGAHSAGVAHAGAEFAARREELGISQRQLAAMKILSAPALIAFEKGRSWPRDRTRAKLERAVDWPPGTLAKLSTGQAAPSQASQAFEAGVKGSEDPTDLLSRAVTMAADQISAAIDALPREADPQFSDRVRTLLADTRQLEALAARAVRSSRGAPEVIKLLREIRQRYDALMTRAAGTPGATLGQRLYLARSRASLSAAEAAGALDLAPEVVLALESEQPILDEHRRRIEAFIAGLAG